MRSRKKKEIVKSDPEFQKNEPKTDSLIKVGCLCGSAAAKGEYNARGKIQQVGSASPTSAIP